LRRTSNPVPDAGEEQGVVLAGAPATLKPARPRARAPARPRAGARRRVCFQGVWQSAHLVRPTAQASGPSQRSAFVQVNCSGMHEEQQRVEQHRAAGSKLWNETSEIARPQSSIAISMSRFIDVPHDRHKSLFKRDPLQILNSHGEVAYEARMERGWSTIVQVVSGRGGAVGSVTRSSFSFSVSIDGEHFSIRPLLFSLVPRYEAMAAHGMLLRCEETR
jgi:hypothetical protein